MENRLLINLILLSTLIGAAPLPGGAEQTPSVPPEVKDSRVAILDLSLDDPYQAWENLRAQAERELKIWTRIQEHTTKRLHLLRTQQAESTRVDQTELEDLQRIQEVAYKQVNTWHAMEWSAARTTHDGPRHHSPDVFHTLQTAIRFAELYTCLDISLVTRDGTEERRVFHYTHPYGLLAWVELKPEPHPPFIAIDYVIPRWKSEWEKQKKSNANQKDEAAPNQVDTLATGGAEQTPSVPPEVKDSRVAILDLSLDDPYQAWENLRAQAERELKIWTRIQEHTTKRLHLLRTQQAESTRVDQTELEDLQRIQEVAYKQVNTWHAMEWSAARTTHDGPRHHSPDVFHTLQTAIRFAELYTCLDISLVTRDGTEERRVFHHTHPYDLLAWVERKPEPYPPLIAIDYVIPRRKSEWEKQKESNANQKDEAAPESGG